MWPLSASATPTRSVEIRYFTHVHGPEPLSGSTRISVRYAREPRCSHVSGAYIPSRVWLPFDVCFLLVLLRCLATFVGLIELLCPASLAAFVGSWAASWGIVSGTDGWWRNLLSP